jgi:hypothetical protein
MTLTCAQKLKCILKTFLSIFYFFASFLVLLVPTL